MIAIAKLKMDGNAKELLQHAQLFVETLRPYQDKKVAMMATARVVTDAIAIAKLRQAMVALGTLLPALQLAEME